MPRLTFQRIFKNHFPYQAIILPDKIKGKRLACGLTREKLMRWLALATKNKEHKAGQNKNMYVKNCFVL